MDMEYLFFYGIYGVFGSGLLSMLIGMPPAERDEALLRCAPNNAIVYVEWAERSPGKEGAPSLDGFVADSEITHFTHKVATVYLSLAGGENMDFVKLYKESPKWLPEALARPGCAFVALDSEAQPGGVLVGPLAILSKLQAGIVLNGGAEGDSIEKTIRLVLKASGLEVMAQQPLKTTIPLPFLEANLARHEDYFTLTVGAKTAEMVHQALAGKDNGLGREPRFQHAFEEIALPRDGMVVWIDAKQVMQVACDLPTPYGESATRIIKSNGLDSIENIVFVRGMDGERAKSRAMISLHERNGLFSLLGGRGIEKSDFAHIPEDTEILAAFKLPSGETLQTLDATTQQFGGEAIRACLNMFKQEFAISIEEDLLPTLGDVAFLYGAPSNGGVFGSEMVLAIPVRDRTRLQNVIDTLLLTIQREAGETVDAETQGPSIVRRNQFRGQEVISILVKDIPVIAPSLCVTETHLFISSHPQPLKSQLRRMRHAGVSFVDKVGVEVPLHDGKLLFASYTDPRAMTRLIYTFVPYYAAVADVEMNGALITAFDIPSIDAILPYMSENHFTVTETSDGILIESGGNLISPPIYSLIYFFYVIEEIF